MRRSHVLPALLLFLSAELPAQRVTVLATGRFDAVSLEPSGGSITRLREFDFMADTPDPAGSTAFSWLPTTGHSAAWGDPHNDNNLTRFNGWKAVFDRFNFTGVFVKAADQASGDMRRVYFTIRDNLVNKTFFVFTTGGTARHQMRAGDYIRWNRNGSVEFFITQDLVMKAAGLQTGTFAPGADGLCQDAARNLYYSPAEGGHWINGVPIRQFANDGSIVMIPAAAITYDAAGNVQDVLADSAVLVVEELMGGPAGEPGIRGMVRNSFAVDRTGTAIVSTNNMVGLALDPAGGTFLGYYVSNATQVRPTVPHFIWNDDGGGFAATIWSTQNNTINNQPGSVAVINGVQMGSTNTTAPADGSYLGLVLDQPNFQPTLMGLTLMTTNLSPTAPWGAFVADAARDGAIDTLNDPTVTLDFGGVPPSTVVFAFLSVGPRMGGFQLSADAGAVVGGFKEAYTLNPPLFFLPVGPTDLKGFVALNITNPRDPALVGGALMFQGLAVRGSALELSNPVLMQFK